MSTAPITPRPLAEQGLTASNSQKLRFHYISFQYIKQLYCVQHFSPSSNCFLHYISKIPIYPHETYRPLSSTIMTAFPVFSPVCTALSAFTASLSPVKRCSYCPEILPVATRGPMSCAKVAMGGATAPEKAMNPCTVRLRLNICSKFYVKKGQVR